MLHELNSNQLSVFIDNKGAELCSVKNAEGLEYMWQADKNVWGRHAPVLFPIVGKLQNNRYYYQSKPYELGQHGFAREKIFDLVFKDEFNLVFELRSQENTKKNYPFDFVLQLAYTLKGEHLTCRYTVRNPSEHELLFCVGAHPGFNLPLKKGDSLESYYLEFETDDLLVSKLKQGSVAEAKYKLELKNKRLTISAELFREDALIFENSQINRLSLCSTTSKHKVSLSCKDWPDFGIWSKYNPEDPQNIRFICLEPWYGTADREGHNQQLEQKKGIICLEPGLEFKAEYTLTFV